MSRTKYVSNPLRISADLTGLSALLDQLGTNAAAAIRPAAQAAAQVLYDEMKTNVQKIKAKSGNLASSIYQVYSHHDSNDHRATYHVSWNARIAPHGGLVEYGHIQRYAVYVRADGKFITKIRPESRGLKKPSKNASQAAKDAYYVPLPAPIQIPARPFARPVIDKFDQAYQAAKAVLSERILTPEL